MLSITLGWRLNLLGSTYVPYSLRSSFSWLMRTISLIMLNGFTELLSFLRLKVRADFTLRRFGRVGSVGLIAVMRVEFAY